MIEDTEDYEELFRRYETGESMTEDEATALRGEESQHAGRELLMYVTGYSTIEKTIENALNKGNESDND